MAQASGASFLHVPFNNPQQSMQGLVSGDVAVYIDGIAPIMPLIKSGRARVPALTTDRALPGFEGIRLVKDTIPGYVALGWFALQGPKGPAESVAFLKTEVDKWAAVIKAAGIQPQCDPLCQTPGAGRAPGRSQAGPPSPRGIVRCTRRTRGWQ